MQSRFTPAALARPLWRALLPAGVRGRLGVWARAALAPHQAAALPRALGAHRRASETVTIMGLFSGRLGVSMSVRLLAQELKAAGVSVHIVDVTDALNAPKDPGAAAATTQDDPGGPLIVALNPDVALPALTRFGPKRLAGRRIIGFWVWELAQAPARFALGRGWVHEIWTLSAFAAQALSSLGAPTFITPTPVALAPPPRPTPADRAAARARFGLEPDTFTTVYSFSLSSSLDRKNPEGLIAAFDAAFGSDPSAALIIRALEADRYPAAAAALGRTVRQSLGRVQMVGAQTPLADLYAAADLYASLHRSEGFGLNLAEAMAIGLPTLATAYSGNLTFMDEACAAMIPAQLTPVRDRFGPYGGPGAQWAAPDQVAAAAHLVRLRADAGLRSQLGAAGQARITSSLQGGAAAAALRLHTKGE